MAEQVDLNVICKHCGAEVSPYITECPYCGERLRKRAPKLTTSGAATELAPKSSRLRFRRTRPRRRATDEQPLAWLRSQRPYGTIALVLASAAVYIVLRASDLTFFDMGAVIGPLDGDWWRLGAAQFVYENVGYLFAVAVAAVIFGSSLERRYGAAVPLLLFLAAGAVGVYLATVVEDSPIVFGGNGSALGLVSAWLTRDVRDRRDGYDSEPDLLGVAAIVAVLALMPLLETTANFWTGLGGAATGAVLGLALPARR